MLEVASMVGTWWIVTFRRSVHSPYTKESEWAQRRLTIKMKFGNIARNIQFAIPPSNTRFQLLILVRCGNLKASYIWQTF